MSKRLGSLTIVLLICIVSFSCATPELPEHLQIRDNLDVCTTFRDDDDVVRNECREGIREIEPIRTNLDIEEYLELLGVVAELQKEWKKLMIENRRCKKKKGK